ncbi:hypothetical protein IFM89_027486 [Coptis chinensis]|uniref:Uncharacterized protein n=1 Tax=Coptis chinensis TaxID=261450 RepID=A0A835H872_9MAGN|nr:hypothetical protein IFM89_027486 [Coptis chinensis]
MRLDNRSVAGPDAHKRINHSIQGSYVAWKHTFEVLHTIVSEGEAVFVIQRGMFLNFRCTSQGGVPWSPGTWVLHDVPDATYVVGLEGSNKFSKPPFVSDYTIIPPVSESRTTGAFQGLFSSRGKKDQNSADELNKNTETEEELEG